MKRQVLSILVENTAGVTSRISGLFSRRRYNIDSFSSGVTADPRFTRITIVTSGDELVLEQIEKQLAKLEDVLDIKKLEPDNSVTRELIMVKDPCKGYRSSGHLECHRDFPWKSRGCYPRFHDHRTDRKAGKARFLLRFITGI